MLIALESWQVGRRPRENPEQAAAVSAARRANSVPERRCRPKQPDHPGDCRFAATQGLRQCPGTPPGRSGGHRPVSRPRDRRSPGSGPCPGARPRRAGKVPPSVPTSESVSHARTVPFSVSRALKELTEARVKLGSISKAPMSQLPTAGEGRVAPRWSRLTKPPQFRVSVPLVWTPAPRKNAIVRPP